MSSIYEDDFQSRNLIVYGNKSLILKRYLFIHLVCRYLLLTLMIFKRQTHIIQFIQLENWTFSEIGANLSRNEK